jgi:transcriptional regulator with XRE-family HTH domain
MKLSDKGYMPKQVPCSTRADEVRRARGLTFKQISECSDFHPSFLSRLLTGRHPLTIDGAMRIGLLLDCAPEALFEPMGSPIPPRIMQPLEYDHQELGGSGVPERFKLVAGLLDTDVDGLMRYLAHGSMTSLPSHIAHRLRRQRQKAEEQMAA